METTKTEIILLSTESFYTHYTNDAYMIKQGTALVYIVPWKISEETAGRKILVGEFGEGKMIPAFSYRDPNYTNWRFAIVSKDEKLILEVLTNSCTNILRMRFLSKIGIDTSNQEGFEANLVELYNRELLKDEVFIQRGVKSAPQLENASVNIIKQTLNEEEENAVIGKSELYNVLHFACKKKKMRLASTEKISSACGEDPSIPDICRVSNLICRSVILDEKWYKSDCGIIIGKIDGHPVACVPQGSKYIIYGREIGKQKLTIKIAGLIEPKAYSIGRSLPQKSISTKELIHFCFDSISKADIGYIILLGIIGALIGILLPTLNQKIYDDYIQLGEYSTLIQMGLLIGTFMVGNLFLGLVKKLFEFRVSCHAAYDFQNSLYYRIFQLPESFFRKYDSADLAQRLSGAEGLASQVINTVLTSGFSFAFSLVYLFRMISYSGKLTIIGLLMVFVYAILIYILNSLTLGYEKQIAEVDGEAVSKLYQFLGGIDKIRMAGVEERFILEYLRPFSEKQLHSIRRSRITSICSDLIEIATYIFSMVLYFAIVKKNIEVTTGSFIAFNSAFGTLSAAFLELTNGIITLRRLKPSYQRIKPVLETEVENEDGKEIVKQLHGEIILENVTFSYSSSEKTILNQFSMRIQQGEYVALVGPSGCGKSTLLKLMLGFEKPVSGKILYDGMDLSMLDKHSLRRNLGVVLQNGRLISGSIYDNVTITAPQTSMKDVNAVIEAVGLKEDIASMPMGLHTVLSESGGTISGGQQQRILIARSIMNHPSILFFDEATSALDNLTQAKVCTHLDSMDVTRIVIAHRLSTIKNCDRIIVIKDGRIAEEGTYDSLMKENGLFYQMASRQLTE